TSGPRWALLRVCVWELETVRDGSAGGSRYDDRSRAALADGAGTATDGDHARLDQLADPERLEHPPEVAELVGIAGHFDGDRIRRDVHHLGPEQLDRVEDLPARRWIGAHLDQHQLAVDRHGTVELDDLDDLDELVQLLGHLLQRGVLDVDDDRHPRDLLVLGGAHGEGLDVEAAPAEET